MSDQNVLVTVSYTLDIPREKAEQLVGRPWTIEGEDDDSFIVDLERAVLESHADLLGDYVQGDPTVEAT